MPRTPSRFLTVLLTAAACGVAAAPASASSINVTRAPAPPSAVLNDGNKALVYTADIDFTGSAPDRYTVDVRAMSSGDCLSSSNPRPAWFGTESRSFSLQSVAGTGYSTGTQSLPIPSGATEGRHCLLVSYFEQDKVVFSSRAAVAFDIARATGTVVLMSYEDANGDGQRQPGERGLPGWAWSLLAGNDTYRYLTAADGTFTLPQAPFGSYRVSELDPVGNAEGWQATTSRSASFTLAADETRRVEVGHIRPTSICGRVFVDANSNGRVDVDERAMSDVSLWLSGRTGTGSSVTRTTNTDSNGQYCFGDLRPGSYEVSERVPGGHLATFDKDGPANGNDFIGPIALISGTPSADNDFGVAPTVKAPEPTPPPLINPAPAPTPRPPAKPKPTRTPQTKLCIGKEAGRVKVRQGKSVTWTIRVRNCGNHRARKVAVTDPLLGDTTLGRHRGATLVRGALVWRIGTMKPGRARTLKVTMRFDRDARRGRHVNRVSAKAANAKTARASASVRVTAKPRPPKRVAVTG